MIPITKPFLPPLKEYKDFLQGIWDRNWLTNNGPMVVELENQLRQYLHLQNALFVTNGTIAIQLALKALGIRKEVITTPFSYVATTSSIVWEGCTPIFADIDPKSLNIDPFKIENVITKDSEAILATHCYGNPCDVEAIEHIAAKYGLKVIYDGAHSFGTKYNDRSIFEYGDAVTTSFHATKLFHTVEGGAIFLKDVEMVGVIERMRNFGHDGFERFNGVGINGKNSELHAAIGIVNLRYVDEILKGRKTQSKVYDQFIKWDRLGRVKIGDNVDYNYAYYPIIFENEQNLLKVKGELERNEIFTRRYFYPSLNTLHYINQQPTPISEEIAPKVLCLPLYYELEEKDQEKICRVINQSL